MTNDKVEGRRRFYKWLFLSWVLAAVVFSVVPLSMSERALHCNKFIQGDYLLHFLVFFIGCLLYRINVKGGNKNKLHFWPRVLLVFMLVFPFLAEVVQLFIPVRTFNWYDALANYTGIALGMVVL